MDLKRTSHAVYDTKYHLVWTAKYRKWVLRGDIREKAKGIFEEISRNHGFEIDTMEIAEDHVHLFLSFPPRYSIARVVGMLKSISASVIFKELPAVKKELWGVENSGKMVTLPGQWETKERPRLFGTTLSIIIMRRILRSS